MTQPQNLSLHWQADGLPSLIGSVPATGHAIALEWILASTPTIPLWPQLPANPRERMLHQFIEGLPGIEETEDHIAFNTGMDSFETEQLAFYEAYLQTMEDPALLPGSRFETSRARAGGLYVLRDMAPRLSGIKAVKGQITGPFTLLTGIHDLDDRIGYYDPTIRDIMVKGLAMKAAWQVQFLRERIDVPVLLFIDEPALAGLGSSALISISREDIARDLGEMTDAIHAAKGMAGVHVCANTDWGLLLDSDIDILSFDAYGFFDRLVTCSDKLHAFLDRGATLAWGLIPTSEPESILQETAESLVALWENQAQMLANDNRDLAALLRQTLITPSCGTGSLSVDLARRVLSLTADVSRILRQRYLHL